ncbi:glycosyltransferase family 4 protein [Marinobacterium sp. xm-g-59]|uniref:glycosyltransferase family 4 protein n=1 Tax=Marinobacterium sp. xm-g-59 TaxID=2497748 RepID=UPI00156A702D|nr:glycosyltransferase family 4 protein [Marinobacterium sp. xm-g-59]
MGYFKILSFLQKSKPDVVVFDGNSSFPFSICLVLSRIFIGFRLVLWSLGSVPHRKRTARSQFGDALNYFYASNSEYVACYSSHAESYFRSLGISQKKIRRAQNAIDTDSLKSYSSFDSVPCILSREKHLIYVGQLAEAKNVGMLIHAFYLSGLFRYGYVLKIIGTGPQAGSLHDVVEGYGDVFSGSVCFTGDLRGQNLSTALLNSRLCILPGRGGLAINTAMHHGLPVVSGPADGTELDLVIDYKTGLYLTDASAEFLAQKLQHVIGDDALLRQLSFGAHQLSWSIATVDQQFLSFVSIFEEIQ